MISGLPGYVNGMERQVGASVALMRTAGGLLIGDAAGVPEKYLVEARLPWKAGSTAIIATDEGVDTNQDQYLTFEIGQTVDPDLYAILPNDWPYNTPHDVEHIVVWSKLPVFHPALVGNDEVKWAKVQQEGFAGFTGHPERQGPPVVPAADGKTFSSLQECGPWGWCTKGGKEVGKMVTTLWPLEEYECAWFVNPPLQLSASPQPARSLPHNVQHIPIRWPARRHDTDTLTAAIPLGTDDQTTPPSRADHSLDDDSQTEAGRSGSRSARMDPTDAVESSADGTQTGKIDVLSTAGADDKISDEHNNREGEKKERERKNVAKKPREQNCIARRLPERCIPPPGHPLYRDPNAPSQTTIQGPSVPVINHASSVPPFSAGNGVDNGAAAAQAALQTGIPFSAGMPSYPVATTSGLRLPAPPPTANMTVAPSTSSSSYTGYMMGSSVSDHDVQYAMGSKRRKVADHRDTSLNDPDDRHHNHHHQHHHHRPASASVLVKPDLSRTSSLVDVKSFPLSVPLLSSEESRYLQHREPSAHRGSTAPVSGDPSSGIIAAAGAGTEVLGVEPKTATTSGSIVLAETTARLARLERLLTLQDHTYVEKRLRLAEEAALRMLEGGGTSDQQGRPGSGTSNGNEQIHAAAGQRFIATNGSISAPTSDHARVAGLRIDTHLATGLPPPSRTLPVPVNSTGDHEEDMMDGHPESAEIKGRFGRWDAVEIIGDAGYTGAEGLNALTAASVLVGAKQPTKPGSSKTFFARKSSENTNHASMENLIGLSQVQAIEIKSLISVLPTIEIAQHLIERYFNLWDWSRYPIMSSKIFPQDWRKFYTGEIVSEMGMPETHHFSAFALLLGTLALGAVSPVLSSADTHVTASTYFWAASKALMYCETAGTNDIRTIWAKSILVRYTDLVRNTQASWHVVGGWIRNAIDQGLHRDGTGFEPPLPPDLTAERRVLWSHVLHADREWALLLGRPLAINQYSTRMPDDDDLAAYPWDYRVYLTTRNNFIPQVPVPSLCKLLEAATNVSSVVSQDTRARLANIPGSWPCIRAWTVRTAGGRG
ncbi:hypothetical protein QFC19_007650 [Naganishia cerealis]|uniref:Uncharacterized protein n=1 Tax=Naganishia cerealis TaxID=610337 RepID=A0ACC2V7V1_9TREE|nr:hypothetical protein QFC19_007650 [Naganishia cerealis]